MSKTRFRPISKLERGVTLLELLVVVGILAIFVAPVLITYQNSRANQALRVSAERIQTTLTTAHIYAREAKDQRVWGVMGSGPGRYTLVNGDPLTYQTTYQIVSEHTLESQIQFVDASFVVWFGYGTGDLSADQSIVVSNRNGKQTEVIIRKTGIVEVQAL